tara:strand:+ start:1519 stop:2046 length:528 start_codon:yes stop_codon:yes gene_type:complete
MIPHHPEQVRRLADICFVVFNADIYERSRKRNIVDARICFAMLLKEQGLGPSCIGGLIGRDHSTIIHYFNKGEALMQTDKAFRKNVTLAREDYSGKDPVYYYSAPELREKYMELRADLVEAKEKMEAAKAELQKIRRAERHDHRILPIINLVRTRTKRGFEDDALQRINRVYNGL